MTSRRLGTVLALWSVAFAVVHAAWALGWRAGVPADVAPIDQRPVFLTYDVVAGLLVAGAAVVALLLARGGLTPARRRLLARLTTVGAVLALLRGVPALAVDVATSTYAGLGPAVDLWFVAAGLLGLLLVRSSPRVLVPACDTRTRSERPAHAVDERSRAFPVAASMSSWPMTTRSGSTAGSSTAC